MRRGCFLTVFLCLVSRFLVVLTSLQRDGVLLRRRPVASGFSELSVLYGVRDDVPSVEARRDAALQRRRRQRRFPGHQPRGRICRVRVRLRLRRSYNQVSGFINSHDFPCPSQGQIAEDIPKRWLVLFLCRRSVEQISMDAWHELRVSRTAKSGILQVDSQRPVEGIAEVFFLSEIISSSL